MKLLALDPLWFGQTRVHEQRVAAARKAFLTGSAPKLLRRNLHPNPRGAYGVAGFRPGIALTGMASVVLSTSGSGVVSTVSIAGLSPSTRVEVPETLPAGVYMCSVTVTPGPGVTHVWMNGSEWVEASEGVPVRISALITNPRSTVFHVSFRAGGEHIPVPVGAHVTISDVLIEPGDTLGEFFDGDTPDTSDTEYRWEGTPGRSPSVADGRGVSHAYPFFPVMLSDSTVQGAYVLSIQGDAEAWPVWEVTGPGEDLLIQNDDTGEKIFIRGQFGERVTITTRPQEQDVVSGSAMDGSLWERVSEDSTFFPLKPGINRIRMSMVNGKPESTVTLKYVEQWMAGF